VRGGGLGPEGTGGAWAMADASVKDMEGAAVAWAAELYGIPYFALKVVTDIGAWGR
jgi:nucleoside phosphorylase